MEVLAIDERSRSCPTVVSAVAGASVLLWSACSGQVTESTSKQGAAESPDAVGDTGDSNVGGQSASRGDSSLVCEEPLDNGAKRRLTRVELYNTLNEAFGLAEPFDAWAGKLPAEPHTGSLYNAYDDLWVDGAFLTAYVALSEALAEAILASDTEAKACLEEGLSERAFSTCARDAVDRWGEKLLREPVARASSDAYAGLLSKMTESSTRAESLASVLQALLLSESFLYRDESQLPLADGENVTEAQDHFAVASALAYLLWAGPPDRALLDAAASLSLGTPSQVSEQIGRMLDNPRALAGVTQFFEQLMEFPDYLFIEKDKKSFPDFSAELLDDMKAETRALIAHIMDDGPGTLDALLTADYSFPSARSRALYDADSGAEERTGSQGAGNHELRVTFKGGTRAGLLTQPGLLAHLAGPQESNPAVRGAYVLKTFLCVELDVPQDVPPLPSEGEQSGPLTLRERFEKHTEDPSCAACHKLIDPLGFSLESYDPLGRYRSTYSAQGGQAQEHEELPVDARGSFELSSGGPSVAFDGWPDLARTFAAHEVVSGCVARQFYRFALGRQERPSDGCVLRALAQRFQENGRALKPLMADVAMVRIFGAKGLEDVE